MSLTEQYLEDQLARVPIVRGVNPDPGVLRYGAHDLYLLCLVMFKRNAETWLSRNPHLPNDVFQAEFKITEDELKWAEGVVLELRDETSNTQRPHVRFGARRRSRNAAAKTYQSAMWDAFNALSKTLRDEAVQEADAAVPQVQQDELVQKKGTFDEWQRKNRRRRG